MNPQAEDFRLSLAGVQEKTALLFHQGQWCLPCGHTPTTHIFKLPLGTSLGLAFDLDQSLENEWLCLKIMQAFGFSVALAELMYFEGQCALVVERFDRQFGEHGVLRLAQEDMCQALAVAPSLKYQADGGPGIDAIMRLLLGAREPLHDRDEFFKAQVVFWLLGALDGHAKNFSIFLGPEGRYSLTPLYDVISAYPWIDQGKLHERKLVMAMAFKGKNNHYKWFDLRRSHVLATAERVGYSLVEAQALLESLLDQVDGVIDGVSTLLPRTFPLEMAEAVFAGMRRMKMRLAKR